MPKPLAIDLFAGLGGWAEGLLAEGYTVIGFDIEKRPYPAQLVLQDVTTLDGSQFRSAALIVASPPCQAYSYRAMPWKRAKALPPPDNSLFEACFRIQREASEAAGRYIPMVVENVNGAQRWVGRARWHYGSYYLWGDVPAIMPFTAQGAKVPGLDWKPPDHPKHQTGATFNTTAEARMKEGQKVNGFNFHGYEKNGKSGGSFQPAAVRQMNGTKGSSGYERNHPAAFGWKIPDTSSHSAARKQASAMIAKIPLPLAQHIAAVYKPE